MRTNFCFEVLALIEQHVLVLAKVFETSLCYLGDFVDRFVAGQHISLTLICSSGHIL